MCPQMDLLVLSCDGGRRLEVYRVLSGELVYFIELGQAVEQLSWNASGTLLAVGCEKSCLVFDANSGKLVNRLGAAGGGCVSFVAVDTERQRAALVDVDLVPAMGRVPPLPVVQGPPGKVPGHPQALLGKDQLQFSSKRLIDLFISSTPSPTDPVELLCLFSENWLEIHYNLFCAGRIELFGSDTDDEITHHLAIDTANYVLTSNLMTMKLGLRSFELDVAHEMVAMAETGSKAVAILNYTDEVLTNNLNVEIRNYLEFSSKLLSILVDELQEKGDSSDAVDHLYELLMTGMMADELKDWFENTVGDRGVKKLERLGNQAFDITRKLIFNNLITSCEKLIVYLNELESLLDLDEDASTTLFSETFVSLKDLIKLMFEFIQKINKEQIYFNRFIEWVQIVLIDLAEDDRKNLKIDTQKVGIYLVNYFKRKSNLLMLIPNLKRFFNKIKINLMDIFELIRAQFRQKSFRKAANSVEIGDATEKVLFKHFNEIIFAICWNTNDDVLVVYSIERFSVKGKKKYNLNSGIKSVDFGVVNDSPYCFIVSGEELVKLALLDDSASTTTATLEPIAITINPTRNLGCLLSQHHFKPFKLTQLS